MSLALGPDSQGARDGRAPRAAACVREVNASRELVLPGHTDLEDLRGFLPRRHPAKRGQTKGDASRILRLAHPVALGHPEKRFNRIGTDRQADVIEP